MIRLAAVLCMVGALLLTSCGSSSPTNNAAEPGKGIYVTSYPLYYFADRLAGKKLDLHYTVPADLNPADWEPDEAVLKKLQQAQLLLINGAGLEHWLEHTSLPPSRIVNTSEGFKDRWLQFPALVTHSHGPQGEHTHSDIDPHTWLNPDLAQLQASRIASALTGLLPEDNTTITENLISLSQDLKTIDAELRACIREKAAVPLIASHPVYNYLARKYGLNLKNLHWEPDEMPSEAEWKKLEALLKDHPAKFMLWEDTPAPEIEQKLAAMQLQTIVFRTAAGKPKKGDYLQEMFANIERLRPAFD